MNVAHCIDRNTCSFTADTDQDYGIKSRMNKSIANVMWYDKLHGMLQLSPQYWPTLKLEATTNIDYAVVACLTQYQRNDQSRDRSQELQAERLYTVYSSKLLHHLEPYQKSLYAQIYVLRQ